MRNIFDAGDLQRNLEEVRRRIRSAALNSGENPAEIILVCVTKTVDVQVVEELIKLGITDIGENRVQDAQNKFFLILQNNVRTHMVGHLQKNKAKYAVKIFDMIHSVDSLQLAEELDRQAGSRGARSGGRLDILLQVNTSGEKTKFGLGPGEILGLVKKLSFLKNINIKGLMTIAPLVKNPEEARPFFKKLREIKEEINNSLNIADFTNIDMRYLSMGMSQDFEIAVQEGANMVRIGSAIIGKGENRL